MTQPKVGTKMLDGSIYAGVSPENGKQMYAMAADMPLTHTFNDAIKSAGQLDMHGHRDWQVPTKAELDVLFENRTAIGGFNLTNSFNGVSDDNNAGCYWSSSPMRFFSKWIAWNQRFSVKGGCGDQMPIQKDTPSSVRCIRYE
jgi:hypothetical protein